MLAKSRFIVGIILIVVAVSIFVFGKGRVPASPGVASAILGLVMIAISRKK